MVDQVLNRIVEELNNNLKRRLQTSEDLVILGRILDNTGKIPIENQDKLLATLIKLEPDTTPRPNLRRTGSHEAITNTPNIFQMDILISAIFSDYQEGLKCLSESISFLQAKSVFTPENTPGLAPEIEKLSLEPLPLSYQDMHSLWAALGVQHLPAMVFKIRGIYFTDEDILPAVSTIN